MEAGPDVRAPLIAAELLETEPEIKSYRKRTYEVVARLRKGAGLRQAEAEAQSVLSTALEEENLGYRQDERLEARPIPRGYSILRTKYSGALVLLMAGVALLHLMICTNVGGLLLVRASARSHDAAVRRALGATSGRLVRQWLAETFLLGALGAAAGFCIVWMAMPLLIRGLPPIRDLDTTILTISLSLKPDGRLLAFAVGLSFLGALLAGLPPALHAAHTGLYAQLRSRSAARQSLRWALVGLQAGLCTLLLAGTVLLVATFRDLEAMDPGFDRNNVVTFSADPRMLGYSEPQVDGLKSRLLAAVREMPDVESAAISSIGVMRGTGIKATVAPAGQRVTGNDFLNTSMNFVTPEYFGTVGIRLLGGRNFRPDEPEAKPVPVVVNSTFARRFFLGADPVGRKLGMGLNHVVAGDFVVIGMVSDAKYRSLREPMPATIYQLWSAAAPMGFVLHVRARARPESLTEPVRRALRAIDPRLPFYDVGTLHESVQDSIWPERALAWLSTVFSLTAVMLAMIAVYGTLAYAISQGRREIGIRMVLGAWTPDILRINSARPMAFVGLGIAAGVAVFYGALPLFGSVIYGISPTDPLNVAPAAMGVLLAGLAAAISASRTALRVDPAEVLRGE